MVIYEDDCNILCGIEIIVFLDNDKVVEDLKFCIVGCFILYDVLYFEMEEVMFKAGEYVIEVMVVRIEEVEVELVMICLVFICDIK